MGDVLVLVCVSCGFVNNVKREVVVNISLIVDVNKKEGKGQVKM